MEPRPGPDRLPLIDFHCHGGDASRIDEIASYIRSEGLTALGLLSLPLAGYPGYQGEAAHLNEAVLETRRGLEEIFSGGCQSVPGEGPPPVQIRAFGCLDNRSLIDGPPGPDAASQVAALQEAGFDGLKIWEGKPEMAAALALMPDSPWLMEACREAGRRGMPVIFHIADPPEFWSAAAGEASLAGRRIRGREVPAFDDIIGAALRLCAGAPEATIIFPHLGFLAGDLERAARFLAGAPNARFDLAPGNYAYAELARQPEAAREFFIRWRHRILFGSDSFFLPRAAGEGAADRSATQQSQSPEPEPQPSATYGLPFAGDSLEGNRRRLRRLKSFLESSPRESVDNVYPLTRDRIPRIPCLGLDPEILEAVFHGNAASLL